MVVLFRLALAEITQYNTFKQGESEDDKIVILDDENDDEDSDSEDGREKVEAQAGPSQQNKVTYLR